MFSPRPVTRVSLSLLVLAALLAGSAFGRAAGTVRWVLLAAARSCLALFVFWAMLGPGARWLTADERDGLSPAERQEAVNQARQSLVQAVTGTAVVAGVVFTAASLAYTARTLDTAQQGQITDRYTKAIEELGADKPEVRMGGIYALERLMDDSSRDRSTILEVLAAYVRSHAQDPPPPGVERYRLAVDVQSALTVISRRRGPHHAIDLRNIDLHGKNLARLDLRGARMTGADLKSADLSYTDLTGVYLYKADLTAARLIETRLSGADLTLAKLTDADLSGAVLTGMRGISSAEVRRVARTNDRTVF